MLGAIRMEKIIKQVELFDPTDGNLEEAKVNSRLFCCWLLFIHKMEYNFSIVYRKFDYNWKLPLFRRITSSPRRMCVFGLAILHQQL